MSKQTSSPSRLQQMSATAPRACSELRSPRPRIINKSAWGVALTCLLLGACSSEGGDPSETGQETGGQGAGVGGNGTGGGLGAGGNGTGGNDPLTSSGGAPGGATGGASIGGAGGGVLGAGGDAPLGTGGDAPAAGGASGSGMLVIEEEQAGFCSVDGIVETTNAGFSGTGYLNANNTMAAGITWSIAIGQAGTYSLSFVYANGGADRPAEVLVDDVTQSANVSFPMTTDWTTWSTVSVDLTLEAGTHSLALEPLSADGLANIDRIELVGSDVAAAECPVIEEPDGTTAITVWLAGDSTVANGSTPCPSGWGKFFANEFNANVAVNNWAVGGRSVRTWLYDVTGTMGGDNECVINTDANGRVIQSRWTDMLAQMKEGDYLFIQFGINDGDSSCPRHVGGGAFKEEYAMMAQAAFARGVQPVFLTPVSMIRCSGNTPIGSRGFLTETFDVGAAEGVPVIDLHQLSVDLYTSLNFCPIPGGDVSASTTGPVGDFFCDDHTHFSDIGGAQIAGVVADAVAANGFGLAAYLK